MERNKNIDAVAGVMITYMVFTHACQHYGLNDTAWYMTLEHMLFFFMPWFFFKAGMFFKVRDNMETFYKGIKRLIVPFVKWSLIGHVCYCFVCWFNGDLHLSSVVPYRSLITAGSIPGNLPLWFLLTLFVCRVIFNILQNKGIHTGIVTAFSLLMAFLMHKVGFVYPYYFANVWTGLFFMSVGYWVARQKLPPPFYLHVSHFTAYQYSIRRL